MNPMDEIDAQINYYDKTSRKAQRWFKWLRIIQALAAVGVSIGTWELQPIYVAAMAGIILVVQTIQEINRNQETWIRFRFAWRALLTERALFNANAGRYATASDRQAFLAERTQEIINREMCEWRSEFATIK